jgi:hypothetical protein
MWLELAVSRALGFSEWALRLVPFLSGVAALLLFCRFATRVLPRRPALLAIAIFAASYYLVRHAAELKPYSTDLLISLSLTMLGWSATQRPDSPTRWTALILAALIAPWCSYPSIFVGSAVILVCGIHLLGWPKRSSTPPIAWVAGVAVALGASFLLMYLFYGKPHAESAAPLTDTEMWARTFPPWRDPWKLPLWLIAIHTGNMFAYPAGGVNGGSAATFVLFVIGALHLATHNRPLLLLLLAPFVLTFGAACFQLYPYGGSVRTSIYLAPAICTLTGLGAWRTLRWIIRRFASISPGPAENVAIKLVTIVCAVIVAIGMFRDWREPSKDPSVTRSYKAIRETAAQVSPGDRWIVFNAIEPVPWAPSLYEREWWGTGGQFVFDCLRFSPVKVEWSPDPAGIEAGACVWLLAYRGVRADFPQAKLDDYVGTLTRRLGTPSHESRLIKEKKDPQKGTRIEGIDVFRFGR